MPLSADARLVLLRIKIERAKEHLRNLENIALACRGKTLHIVLPQDNSKAGDIIPKRREDVPVYSFEMLAVAGDAIHSLRSALDHLAYQLAIIGSGKPPSRRVEFPIAKDRDTYEAEKARKVEGIRPEAIEAIDALKPYKGGNDTLWRIHQLDNIDKHRFVFVIGNDALFEASWYDAEMPFLIRPRTLNTDSSLFSGVFDSEMENDMYFEIDEAFSETKIGEGGALIPTLSKCVTVVEKLIGDFRRFLN